MTFGQVIWCAFLTATIVGMAQCTVEMNEAKDRREKSEAERSKVLSKRSMPDGAEHVAYYGNGWHTFDWQGCRYLFRHGHSNAILSQVGCEYVKEKTHH